ncbi:MAG: phosphoglycolate phosphatase [Pseudomonadota bacterium]
MVWRKPYQAYLFDLDGTLIDTAPDLNLALNHSLERAGLAQVPETLTRHWIGHGAKVMVEQALQYHEISDTGTLVNTMFDDFLEYYADHNAHLSKPYPTVLETLRTLYNQGKVLCVVTNKLEHFSRSILDQLDMSDYFAELIGGDTATKPKPDPAPIHLCLERISVPYQDALFVGDSATDVGAARNANMTVVCMRDGYNHGTPAHELGADGVIDRFEELL